MTISINATVLVGGHAKGMTLVLDERSEEHTSELQSH